jgi:hypothetical protein
MRTRLVTLLAVLALASCNKKDDKPPPSETTKPVDTPTTCPPGNAVRDGKCIPVVTPEKVAAVAQQQSRLDDLAKILDKVDSVTAPIELLDGLRQQDAWKQLAAKSDKLKIVDDVVVLLNEAVKQLRAFKGTLADAAGRLGNLHGELDRILKQTGAAQQLADLRKEVSTEIRAALQPLQAQVTEVLQKVIVPLLEKLDDASNLILGACTAAKLSGGGDQLKALCGQAKDVFAKAIAFLEDAKAKPVQLYTDVTNQLESQLTDLIDAESKKFLDEAQTKVNEALKLPAAGSGSGSSH